MTKSQLIEEISEKTKITKKLSEDIINIIFDSMSGTLKNNGRIEIRGFGAFTIREYKSYQGRNPKTGEKVYVEGKKLPFFKVGKELKERVTI